MLANDWSLRQLVPAGGWPRASASCRAKPATAFSPVAVTPDGLGEAWFRGKMNLTLQASVNGRRLEHAGGRLGDGLPTSDRLIAPGPNPPGARPVRSSARARSATPMPRAAWAASSRSVPSDRRRRRSKTEYLKFGDVVRIRMKGRDGLSVFSAIEQGSDGARTSRRPEADVSQSHRRRPLIGIHHGPVRSGRTHHPGAGPALTQHPAAPAIGLGPPGQVGCADGVGASQVGNGADLLHHPVQRPARASQPRWRRAG